MIETSAGTPIDRKFLQNYFGYLVNQFFKILPMRENQEESLSVYIRSLQLELLGCQRLITEIEHDAAYVSLLSILQYLIDHPYCKQYKVKREIFRAISICNQLQSKYSVTEVV